MNGKGCGFRLLMRDAGRVLAPSGMGAPITVRIGAFAAAILTVTAGCSRSHLELPVPATGEHYRFTVGGFEMVALLDGTNNYRGDRFFVGVPADSVRAALTSHGISSPDTIPSTFTALAVREQSGSGGWTVLDGGVGNLSPTGGRMLANLAAGGIAPGDVRRFVITHAHPDHVGVAVRDDGQPTFPNATYIMAKAEWDAWTSPDELAKLTGVRAEAIRKRVLPLRGRITLVGGDTDVAPGIHLLASPGHTPGHMVAIVGRGSTRVLFLGDAALHPIHLEHPDWKNSYDADGPAARRSRDALLDRAASEHMLVLAYHFAPFPSLGWVRREGAHWQWRPVGATEP